MDFGDFLSSIVKFDTLAGTRLAAKNKMAQALPFLMEVFSNQAIVQQLSETGWKVDVMELVNMVLDMSEWKNKRDLVVPMSDQEKQQQMMNNPAVQKAQADAAKQKDDQQFQMAMEDKKIAGRIAAKSIETTHKPLIESPLERAASFAERTSDERQMQASQYYGTSGGG